MAVKKETKNLVEIIPLKNQTALVDAIAELGSVQREKENLVAGANKKMGDIQTQLQADVSPLDAKITSIAAQIKHFSDNNREELYPDGTKTRKLPTGSLQYRTIPAAVKTKLTQKITEKILVNAKLLDMFNKFVEKCGKIFFRVKLELNKEAVLADPSGAKKLGIEIGEESERFYIKPSEIEAEIEAFQVAA
ncbi:MAG: host-nuclease inhibitor Gam family protein [Leptospira sp.]|nr:host-nuclease inhibitor Gam family protein [Leptospira sp.]